MIDSKTLFKKKKKNFLFSTLRLVSVSYCFMCVYNVYTMCYFCIIKKKFVKKKQKTNTERVLYLYTYTIHTVWKCH